MSIRIKKLHLFIFMSCFVLILFIFALRADPASVTVNEEVGLRLPIVMYHHTTTKESRAGKYVILQSEFEKDLDFLKEHGYTTVTISDLIKYIGGEIKLPEKVIMITFDDGFESFYELAFPLLKKHEMKAVLSVVGSYTDTYSSIDDKNVNYAYLTWDDLSELSKSGIVEIQNHTYNMHNNDKGCRKGLARVNGESADVYAKALSDDLLKMQNLLLTQSGITATAVAYPFGSYSKQTLNIIKELGFKSSLVCEERINNIIPGDSESLYNLGRFNRPSGISTEEFFGKILYR